MSFQIRQVTPIVEPVLGDVRWQYADSFEITLDRPDDHPAEVWIRAALDGFGTPMRQIVRLVHRHLVRFDADASGDLGMPGWRDVLSEQDVAAVEADGPLLRAVIVARRHSPTRCTGSTYLFFHKPKAARVLWLFVRPVHLQAEKRLLIGAAKRLT
jgi:hypothetical protein